MPGPIRKILIVKLSSLGDVVHALPVLSALRDRFPEAHIAWAVEETFHEVLQHHPALNEVIAVQTRQWRRRWNLRSLGQILALIRRLRRGRFDLVLDLQGLIKSGLLTGLSGAPRRAGFHPLDCRERPSSWFTNLRPDRTHDIPHVVDKNLALLSVLGIDAGPPRFSLTVNADADAYISDWLSGQGALQSRPLAAIHAGVGYPTKAWPTERFAALGDRLHREMGVHVLLTWGPTDRDRAASIAAQMREPHRLGPETASLLQAMALYRRLRLFISGDTGPLHLCAALTVPTVSIFGPTDPARNGPYGQNHEVVCQPQPCSFCFKRSCFMNHECMDHITVDQVVAAARKQMQPPQGALVS